MTKTQELLLAQKTALRECMAEVRAQIDAVKTSSAEKQAQLDEAITAHQTLAEAIEQLSGEVDAIEQPHLTQLKAELAGLAKAEAAIVLE